MSLQDEARLALACLDLTTLNDGHDTAGGEADVAALAKRARGPFGAPAALCVWPRLAAFARREAPADVAIAAVANFPHGGTDVDAAARDTSVIVDAGAQEVDVVLPWRAFAAGDVNAAADLLRAVRRACEGRVLKVILETGELADDALIRRAAMLALAEGADFLKTSTGKVPVGATPPAARALLETIAATPGSEAGFKASGGVRSVADAALYAGLVREILGPQALTPRRFRLGASGLLNDIEAVLGGGAAPSAATGY
ncbi:MAG: deoxyribose-phosphate aldolase [Burkholderiaceae bacterium]|nr:deoxyribose-phosphate aldolase [Burkholderiaceae bacterium]